MANKATIISDINAQITAVITQAKHRLSMLPLVNELFQTTTHQEMITGSDVFWVNLYYKKQGNIVYLNGYITNKYSISKSSQGIASIPGPLYYAKTGQDTICSLPTSDGSIVQCSISGSGIYLIGSLAPNQQLRFNIHYQTND